MNAEPEMRIPNIRVPRSLLANPDFGGVVDGDHVTGTLILRQGRIAGLTAETPTAAPRLILPKLTEAHCHLDKCHSIVRMGDVGGDLMAAIDAQATDKANWTEADLTQRAQRGLIECQRAGCGTVRSHIDWGAAALPPLAWHVLPQVQSSGLGVQWAALTGIDHMADASFAASVARAIADTPGGVLGSFVLDHDPKVIRAGLRNCFAQAERLGLALDFHVDETLDDLNGVEAIADMALETGHQGPILCGHAVALMTKPQAQIARIADKLARANITICALPTTNLYLQSRTGGTPDRRGITRLSELADRGVRITVGSDNVADAFCPLGQHDPMAALHLACLTAHLDPPLARLLPMITTDARTALGLDPVTVDTATPDQLLISDASSVSGLIAGHHLTRPLTQYLKDTQTPV